MFIALRDLWRAKLRFGLLAGAVSLLMFLLLFLNTLSATLLGFFVGALENNSADVLVYDDTARRNLQASRLDASLLDEVAAVPGVGAAAPIGELTLTVEVVGNLTDLSLWGVDLDGPGGPSPIVAGRAPGPGEVVVDESGVSEGFEIGETIVLVPSGVELEIVGYARDARYAVIATAYTAFEEWSEVFAREHPGAATVPLSLIGVEGAGGEDPAALADRIAMTIGGVEGLEPDAAAAAAPGVDSISQSFAFIIGITFAIVVLVVGFFFLILTVQKLPSLVTLRAIGASTAYLARSLIAEITIMVLLGSVFAVAVLWLTTFASSAAFPLGVDGRLAVIVMLAVLVFSIVAGLFSIRRIAGADPAEAAQGTR